MTVDGGGDLLRIRRLARSCHARAGLGWVLLPLACASVAAQASASTAYPRGPAEPDQPRPAAAAGAEDEDATARLAQVDQELAEIDRLLATAHFHTALAVARATRDLLDRFGEHPQLGARQARLEVMAATAEVALGRRAPARRSMLRALRAEPNLTLDEREASPKLLELLRGARRRAGVAEPEP
jgi:hypothetical protein